MEDVNNSTDGVHYCYINGHKKTLAMLEISSWYSFSGNIVCVYSNYSLIVAVAACLWDNIKYMIDHFDHCSDSWQLLPMFNGSYNGCIR